ncbi:MAG: GNAT family N-acetyltransferase [Tetrasphaera sp.]
MNSSTSAVTAPVRVHALAGGEIALVRQVFDSLSDRSRWRRFHTGVPRLPASYLSQLANVVPGERVVLLAMAGARPLGHGEWTRDRGQRHTAEIALTVVDDLHGQGIGLMLADALASAASHAGVHRFACHTLPSNDPVRRWLARCDAVADPGDDTRFTFAVADLRAAIRAHTGSLGYGETACA